ncbi:MAG TPA: carbon-nitrogen hydrolase family protein [Trebonia sp.]|nr:carbon-nitrogen hydrolase family protein [Trebonia sp.]
MSTTRVAAWQCLPGPLDVAGNLRRLDSICASAAAQQVKVLVTPEMFTSGYAITLAEVVRLAEDAGGPTEAAVAEIARRHGLAIVYGHPERAPGGSAYNAATMTGPDGVVRGRHRKVHLYGEVDRGQFVASPARPAAFSFGGSRAGMLICYDVEFPESVRCLTVDGARVVFVPTANMTGCEEVQEILVRARACENNCGVVYANYCGSDDVFEYNGLSMICGPRGEVLAQAGTRAEELVVADLPGESTGTYLADRRGDLYGRCGLPELVHGTLTAMTGSVNTTDGDRTDPGPPVAARRNKPRAQPVRARGASR